MFIGLLPHQSFLASLSHPPSSQHRFAAVESFGITAWSIALHSSQPHKRKKCFLLKPAFAMLRLKCIHNAMNFLLAGLYLKRNEHAGLSQGSVIFRNLVFQNQMISERMPSQFGNQAVILMRVIPIVTKNEVRGHVPFQLFENSFYFSAHKWHESVGETLQKWSA